MSPASPPEPSPPPKRPIPSSILILGAGVFGLSTTLALLSNPRYEETRITLVDTHLPSLHSDPTPPHPQSPTTSPAASQPSPQRHNADTTTQTAKDQNPHSASHDSSRIVRPDYANPAYARLALLAQHEWRGGFAQSPTTSPTSTPIPIYKESGIILTANSTGSSYVERARENAEKLGCVVKGLGSREEIARVLGAGTAGEGRGDGGGGGGEGNGGNGVGERGYVNWGSGWVDASAAMRGVMDMVLGKARARNRGGGKGRVLVKRGRVRRLIFEDTAAEPGKKKRVLGALLASASSDSEEVRADLTILALGAWTPSLLDLRGRAEATAQIIAYIPLSAPEASRLSKMPVLLNLSTGMFVIPPVWDPLASGVEGKGKGEGGGGWILKVANHSCGYTNPTRVSPEGEEITTSLPASTFTPIPPRAESALRDFLKHTIPWLGERAFCGTRICWYTDTPSGDFLIDYHPGYEGCFLATGGSGHGFKFLPVLGERIVEGVEGALGEELGGLWRWREGAEVPFRGTEDGSRRGERGVLLGDELGRGREGKSKL